MTGAPDAPRWPQRPRPGAMVRLPLALPPMLLDAAGYERSARHVALWWEPAGDELTWSDGRVTADGDAQAWLCLTGHPLGRAILGPYRLGDSETAAEELLLCDRWQGTLDVGLRRDVERLVASRPSEPAITRALKDAGRCTPVSGAGLTRRLRREAELVGELGRWLDELAERLLGGD